MARILQFTKAVIYVGTSGWHDPRFFGVLYPRRLDAAGMLRVYGEHYNTVEVSSRFYRALTPINIAQWISETPSNFVFSIKANHYLTHFKQRQPVADGDAPEFMTTALKFGKKLGPILFQLPPSIMPDLLNLEILIKQLPTGFKYALEVRQPEYAEVGVLRLLEQYGIAYCMNDFREEGINTVTCDFVYARLHGPAKIREGSYSDDQLRHWARAIADWDANGRDVYVYFNNANGGHSILNSFRLKELLRLGGGLPTKTLNVPNEAIYMKHPFGS